MWGKGRALAFPYKPDILEETFEPYERTLTTWILSS